MNRQAASKEGLLEAARSIAYKDGLSKVSIRRLAAESGIAIGTVYNYFPSKADLVAGIIEEFWRNVFHGRCFNINSQEYIESIEEIYQRLHVNLAVFKQEFLDDLSGLSKEEKEKSSQSEQRYMEHMKVGVLEILKRDTRIMDTVWTAEFTQERLVEFTFSNMQSLLSEGKGDFGYLKIVLERILYQSNKEKWRNHDAGNYGNII